jgi:DedD protein
MDRRVKERLIGATILVAIAVLVVPELLSGPKTALVPSTPSVGAPEPTRTVTVDLASPPSATAEPVPAAPPGSATPRTASGTPGSVAALGTAIPSPKSTVVTPTAAGGAATASAPATASPAAVDGAALSAIPSMPDHAWAVQIGSFASSANADKLLRQLKAQGYSAYISTSGPGAAARYRVRVGPLADREAASQTVAKLQSAGHIGNIVPPTP